MGEGGNDLLTGGADVDTIKGGDGSDELTGGPQHDVMKGQASGDVFHADDGFPDDVKGGTGTDEAFFDDSDDLSSIEIRHQQI